MIVKETTIAWMEASALMAHFPTHVNVSETTQGLTVKVMLICLKKQLTVRSVSFS